MGGYLRFHLKGREFWITVYANGSTRQIGVLVRGNERYGATLFGNKEAIESQLGEPVTWNEQEAGVWNIGVIRGADPAVIDDWPAQHQWLAGWLEKFTRVMTPYLEAEAL